MSILEILMYRCIHCDICIRIKASHRKHDVKNEPNSNCKFDAGIYNYGFLNFYLHQ